jgi:hypothetical protein
MCGCLNILLNDSVKLAKFLLRARTFLFRAISRRNEGKNQEIQPSEDPIYRRSDQALDIPASAIGDFWNELSMYE